jgi:hypothetical protein
VEKGKGGLDDKIKKKGKKELFGQEDDVVKNVLEGNERGLKSQSLNKKINLIV